MGNFRRRTYALHERRSVEHRYVRLRIIEGYHYLNGFIASVYTELNAVSKGTSLGIFTKDDDRGVEAAKDGSQPYIELMGRRWVKIVQLQVYNLTH